MRTVILAPGLTCLLSASLAAADPSSQLLGGLEVSSDASYAYLGHVTPLPGSSFGNGFARRLWIDLSQYRYDKNGSTYDVSAPGAEIAVCRSG